VPMSSEATSAVRLGIGRVFGVWLQSRPVMLRHRLFSSSCP
jgi:hypothetical protein